MKGLPYVDKNNSDKFMVFKISPEKDHDLFGGQEANRKTWEKILSQLTALVHMLMRNYLISPDVQEKRYGVERYKNPELFELLGLERPEARLLEYFNSKKIYNKPLIVCELYKLIQGDTNCSELDDLVTSVGGLAKILSKCLDVYSDRVMKGRKGEKRHYTFIEPES